MKKLLLPLFLIFISCLSVLAQEDTKTGPGGMAGEGADCHYHYYHGIAMPILHCGKD